MRAQSVGEVDQCILASHACNFKFQDSVEMKVSNDFAPVSVKESVILYMV